LEYSPYEKNVKPVKYFFTLKVWNTREIIIHIDFEHPMEISSGEKKDRMNVNIKLLKLFVTSTGQALKEENYQKDAEIPR
jgi:hypothetical protein